MMIKEKTNYPIIFLKENIKKLTLVNQFDRISKYPRKYWKRYFIAVGAEHEIIASTMYLWLSLCFVVGYTWYFFFISSYVLYLQTDDDALFSEILCEIIIQNSMARKNNNSVCIISIWDARSQGLSALAFLAASEQLYNYSQPCRADDGGNDCITSKQDSEPVALAWRHIHHLCQCVRFEFLRCTMRAM